MDRNWRRVLIVSSIVFSFLLVCGSIYLHLKQKNHLGRLRHDDDSIFLTGGVEAASDLAMALPVGNFTEDDYGFNAENVTLSSDRMELYDWQKYDDWEESNDNDDNDDDEYGEMYYLDTNEIHTDRDKTIPERPIVHI